MLKTASGQSITLGKTLGSAQTTGSTAEPGSKTLWGSCAVVAAVMYGLMVLLCGVLAHSMLLVSIQSVRAPRGPMPTLG
jgi:hypothetical protein